MRVEQQTETGRSCRKTYSLASWLIWTLICCIVLFSCTGKERKMLRVGGDSVRQNSDVEYLKEKLYLVV